MLGLGKKQSHSLSLTKVRLAHFKISLQGHLFLPFPGMDQLHSSKGTYAVMEIMLEVTQALLLLCPS